MPENKIFTRKKKKTRFHGRIKNLLESKKTNHKISNAINTNKASSPQSFPPALTRAKAISAVL